VLHEKLKNEKVFASRGGGGTGVLAQRKDLEERVTAVPNVRIPKKEDPHTTQAWKLVTNQTNSVTVDPTRRGPESTLLEEDNGRVTKITW